MSRAPCIPDTLPIDNLNWKRLVPFINRASLSIGRYNGTLDGMVNAAVLLSPITSHEAILSSRIEGTVVSMTEVLGHEAGELFSEEKRSDIKEITNYRRALLTAEEALNEHPVTLSLIRALHAMLMEDVRGGDKTPGAFRTDQNWIGPRGCTIEEARFVPPNPMVMRDALENLETFIASDETDPLTQLAIIHAQFEIIHPFNDGNGRLGRMLVPLLLYQKHILQRPMFYLSEYLEASDQEYRERLLAISDTGDWQGWVEFFLTALHHQAEGNITKARRIHTLYEEMKARFRDLTHSQFAVAALDAFFTRPILDTKAFIRLSGISNRGTANAMLRALAEQGMIQVIREGSGRRSAAYAFPRLINIAEGRELF
ncbi:MAG: Fic family protein [Magnetococcales bacterium]|nr:Fic family protein [Magnetococcales bacterium]